jgi:hypothetical protein
MKTTEKLLEETLQDIDIGSIFLRRLQKHGQQSKNRKKYYIKLERICTVKGSFQMECSTSHQGERKYLKTVHLTVRLMWINIHNIWYSHCSTGEKQTT